MNVIISHTPQSQHISPNISNSCSFTLLLYSAKLKVVHENKLYRILNCVAPVQDNHCKMHQPNRTDTIFYSAHGFTWKQLSKLSSSRALMDESIAIELKVARAPEPILKWTKYTQ